MVQFILVLDEPRRAYAPGDTITGRVTMLGSLPGPLPAQARYVTLLGRAKCKVRKRRNTGGATGGGTSTQTYRSRAALVCVSKSVDAGSMWTEPAPNLSTSWPFAITVPNQPQRLHLPDGRRGLSFRSYWDHFEAANGFAGSTSHPLPPTFKNEYRFFSKRVEAYVEYHLSAAVVVNGKRNNIAKEIPVRIVPVAPPPDQLAVLNSQYYSAWANHTIKSLRLLPENADRELTFKENAKQFFKSSSLPVFRYKVHVLLLRAICAGDHVRLELRMEPLEPIDPKAKAPPQTPPVTLKRVSIELRALNACRTAGLLFDNVESNDLAIWSRQGAFSKIFDPALEYKESIDMGTIPVRIAPTFVTYNIRVNYVAKIKIITECAGEVQKSECQITPRLLGRRRPPVQAPGGDASSSADGAAPAYAAEDWGELTMDDVSEELPSYGEVVGLEEPAAPAISKTSELAT